MHMRTKKRQNASMPTSLPEVIYCGLTASIFDATRELTLKS